MVIQVFSSICAAVVRNYQQKISVTPGNLVIPSNYQNLELLQSNKNIQKNDDHDCLIELVDSTKEKFQLQNISGIIRNEFTIQKRGEQHKI